MNQVTENQINIEQLMSEIRAAVAQREAEGRVSLAAPTLQLYEAMLAFDEQETSTLELSTLRLQPEFVPNPDDRYHINDLLQYHDHAFIWNAYRAILKREPDEPGLNQYLKTLRSGRINKIDVLASLRFSVEGESNSVYIEGLERRPFIRRLYRVPVFGYLLETLVAIVRLPKMIHSQRQYQEHVAAQDERVANHVNQVGKFIQSLSDELSELSASQKKIVELQHQQVTVLVREQLETKERLDKLRLAFSKRVNGVQSAPAESDESRLDELLVAFADEFRGSRDDVREGLRRYLPLLETANIRDRILDLGCGRGEWLELLKESGLQAEGVESNEAMFERARSLGLDLVHSDALTHLRSLPEGSVNAITAFHFVEHLTFAALVELIDETLRVLRSGGLLILETPNPKNLVVGACNFHSDPTHHKPLFPETLRFILSEKGFTNTLIEYINPAPDSPFKEENEISRAFDSWFYSARDFAVIGTKPDESSALD
ncbi:MAG TPA: methyltransferase domain-containing protein [Pyrinomonadaceae bacterium]|nr:methyltransferase domain-containing protein [Pyrinomonadaceae bacterium]